MQCVHNTESAEEHYYDIPVDGSTVHEINLISA